MTTRRTARTGIVALAAAAVAATAFTAPAQADAHAPKKTERHAATQRAMDDLVRAGTPGVIAQLRTESGVWNATSGVSDVTTGKPRSAKERYRIASITKTFVAAVLLDQEADGLLSLDDTVDKWLPGVVRGNGNDGRKMTVRQLLNHSTGLFEYSADPEYFRKHYTKAYLKHRYDTWTPLQTIRVGLAHQPDFAPGAKHAYSNTGYVLAGLVIEKASGNSYAHEVRKRILKPLGLRDTTLPGNSVSMPNPHSKAYGNLSEDPGKLDVYDVTEQNGSQAFADGDIISTTSDVTRFLQALLGGELLPAKQLTAMKAMLPNKGPIASYDEYGLGLYSLKTSCGIKVWGHSGGASGAGSEVVGTEDGKKVFALNINGDWDWSDKIRDSAFCGTKVKAADPAFKPLR
ncbi:serine hydrolase domain-containing protein [Streptomyces amakusaensis]|uniref:Serine hydrolase domain-containing protein n=1 Tax=Streptomyces amakusaensis TaxID=67271 RepID=A0ABW0ALN1_9ACTN